MNRLRRLLRSLGAVAGLTGAAALVGRSLRDRHGAPTDVLGGKRLPWTWRGYDIFVTEFGAGPPILLVHGIYAGASSFEYRKLVPLLARTHRVVVLDLVGCGLSAMPPLDYSGELFVEQVVDAIGELFDGPLTLVGTSLGGAFAIRAATRAPDRVERLVTIVPTGLGGILDKEPTLRMRALTTFLRTRVLGESAFNALASRPSIGWFLREQTYADKASVTPEVLDRFSELTHQPGARYVAAAFVGQALNIDVARDLPFVEMPLLVLWGEESRVTNPVANAPLYVQLAPDARLETFAHAALLPHEERPEDVAAAIEAFIGRDPESGGPPAIGKDPESGGPPAIGKDPKSGGPSAIGKDPESGGPPAIGKDPGSGGPPVAGGDSGPGERPSQARTAPAMPTRSRSGVFKSYDIRGLYPEEIDDDLAYAIGRAFVETLGVTSVVAGRDMRPSGVSLFEHFARGCNDAGADVTDIGLVSTDALYFAVGKYAFAGGVMITASHNPAQYNGMKLTRDRAQAISLETGLSAIRDRIAQGDFGPPVRVRGTISQRDILDDFAEHCLTFVDRTSIKPFKIAIDAGNGMAGLTVPYVFKHLPCDVIPMYFELDGTFPNHPASPIEPENMVDLQKAVLANGCDLGVAFDGDADRMFVVDEKGALVGGDIVTALVAMNTLRKSPGSKILYNLICSRSVPEAIVASGGTPVRSQVGHSLIKKTMRDEDVVFGGEHSGHFYFRDNWFADSGMIALLQCLEVFSAANEPVSKVIAPIDKRYRSGEINSPVGDIAGKLAALEEHFGDGEIDHLDGVTIQYPDAWLNVRPSNTEPLLRLNVEGDTQATMERRRDEALALIRS